MSSIPFLIRKEFLQLKRNTFMPKIIVAMPLALMLVFPWAANQEVKNVNVAVVDLDHTPSSARLINRVSASSYFNLTDYAPSYDEALSSVQRGKSDIILQIDPDGNIQISANAVNGTKGTLGSAYLQQIVQANISDETHVTTLPSLNGRVGGEAVSQRYLFNPTLDYKNFMVPALMVMLLTLLSGFLPALNIVSEKEKGTIEQINVSPVTRIEFILGKLIPYWIIGFFEITLSMAIAWLVYGMIPQGSLLTIYFFAMVYILGISGLGLVISNFSDTMQQAMFVMFFFMLIFLLMSGLFTPVTSMPGWAQWIAAFSPLKYFMEVMRMVYMKGCSILQLSHQFYALVAFAVVFNTLAIWSYRKNN